MDLFHISVLVLAGLVIVGFVWRSRGGGGKGQGRVQAGA